MEYELSIVGNDSMPCVVPAVEPRDDLGVSRQDIDNLAFGLIAPLGAKHCCYCHSIFPFAVRGCQSPGNRRECTKRAASSYTAVRTTHKRDGALRPIEEL